MGPHVALPMGAAFVVALECDGSQDTLDANEMRKWMECNLMNDMDMNTDEWMRRSVWHPECDGSQDPLSAEGGKV